LISCNDFTFDGIIDGTSTDGILTLPITKEDYLSGKYEPGEYEVSITGTPVKATDGRTATVKFIFRLIDPCESPTITVPALEDQLYKLTSASDSYVHPEFTIVPDYCTIVYQYSVTSLSSGGSAISAPTGTDKTFTIFYGNNDDAPINPVQTQTVTITATSGT
jgi:hypothetical protein